MRPSLLLLGLAMLAAVPAAFAQQPFSKPPPSYTLTPEERSQLDLRRQQLADRLKGLRPEENADAAVFLHVARMADQLGLYANKNHVAAVLRGLETGLQRADLLGVRPWRSQPGRTLRGYVSRIDGSVQPYGVVLPADFDPTSRKPWRLDVVLHGRGPTEVTFLQQNEPPRNTRPPDQPYIELHPFGRGNNGWRWAGETDVFEALEDVRKQYSIDPNRIILRGFSMGGHGAWHMGVHYPDLWAAVSPGAGFSETGIYRKSNDPVPAYQEQGWHLYDAVDYALNAAHTPFIAYGGEKDPQLQASLQMRDAMAKEGLALNLIVGPNTEHAYHPDSLKEIMRQLETHKREPRPKQVKFTTWTLKYNRSHWVILNALQEHYRRATVKADAGDETVTVTTENVAGLFLGPIPTLATQLQIDGQRMSITPNRVVRLSRKGQVWSIAKGDGPAGLAKRKGLQGPIDDAFTDRFLLVRGTGAPWSPAAQTYADGVLRRFQEEWRLGFRGEAPVKDDRDVAATDWDGNLVLFGDPGSNSVLAKIIGKLPVRWTREGFQAAGRNYGPDHLPVLIYPNPLNPKKYVVLNSGHTWTRKEIEASNVHLTPKLPDWAVLRLGAAPEVVNAGYFDEAWGFKAAR